MLVGAGLLYKQHPVEGDWVQQLIVSGLDLCYPNSKTANCYT